MSRTTIRRQLIAATLVAGVFLTTLVGTAPSASAATEANRNYVRALYADLLDRTDLAGDDAGVEYWANQLGAGASRTQVARAIQNSSKEYYGNIVEFSYQRYLDRSADLGGFNYFVNGWRAKAFTLETVTSVLVGSREYYVRHGSNNSDYLDAAYFDILGREIDSAGRSYFLGVIAAHGRGAVARVLVTSTENRRNEIRFAIDSYLGRLPAASAGELDFYVNLLRAGVRREEIDVLLVGSAEYFANNS